MYIIILYIVVICTVHDPILMCTSYDMVRVCVCSCTVKRQSRAGSGGDVNIVGILCEYITILIELNCIVLYCRIIIDFVN